MTHENDFKTPFHPTSLTKRILIGAAIGFTLITFFLIGAEGKPEWGKLWMIRPMIVVPLAGAGAGWLSYQMDELRSQRGWKQIFAMLATVIVYVIALWLGIVLGLAGTLWD